VPPNVARDSVSGSETASRTTIRVALVITGLEVGGAEKCLTQLALYADREQFAIEVYSLQPRPTGDKARLVEQLELGGVRVHFLDASSTWSAPRVVLNLRRHFQRQQPQVVQSFLYHANVVSILAARLAAIRWVFTGIRVADPNPYRRQIERSLYGFAALNVCVSRSVAASYQASGFQISNSLLLQESLWHRTLHVIPNAVDTAPYADAVPADLGVCGFGPERRVLLFVGRLEKQKGLDWLIACLPDLLARLPDHELVLIGNGPQRDALMRQAVRLGVADHVHVLGWRPDVPQLLKRADVLVLPSRYEGMPNVLLEALSAGVPVVATRAEGIEEVVGDLADFCLVNFGRSHDLVTRIVQVAADGDAREALIRKGQQRVQNGFSIQAMVESYQRLWRLPTSAAEAPAACP
jgi:glycosyltransferase involved in cell wall biosynthesis